MSTASWVRGATGAAALNPVAVEPGRALDLSSRRNPETGLHARLLARARAAIRSAAQ